MDGFIVWRLFNAAVALLALLWLALDLRLVWCHLTPRRLYLTFALGGALGALVAGSIEHATGHVYGVGTALATASAIWCLVGLSKGDRS